MTWNELYEQCRICDKCPLGKTKTNTVFGCGNQNARLMFVGEAPGEQEDKEGIPFVGAAGKLLDKYLDAVGILRDEVYIANILKCRRRTTAILFRKKATRASDFYANR